MSHTTALLRFRVADGHCDSHVFYVSHLTCWLLLATLQLQVWEAPQEFSVTSAQDWNPRQNLSAPRVHHSPATVTVQWQPHIRTSSRA